MKKLLLVCFGSLLSLIVVAQQNSFFTTYSSNQQIKFWNVESTSDGGYILCGSHYSFNGGNFIVLKTDSNGNEIWRYINSDFNGTDNDNSAFRVKETPDNGFLVAGSITKPNSIDNLIYAKLNLQGILVWKKELNIIGAGTGFAAFDFLFKNDSSCIFTFNKNNNAELVELNCYTGDTTWTSSISIYPFSFIPRQIRQFNNSFYLFGVSDSLGQSFQWNTTVKTDTLGNYLWHNRTIDTSSVLFYCDSKLTSDSNFIRLSINKRNNLPPFFRVNVSTESGTSIFQNSIVTAPPNISGAIINDSLVTFPAQGLVGADSINIWQTNFLNNSSVFNGGFYHWDNFSTNTIVDNKNNIVNCGYVDPGQSSIGFLMRITNSISSTFDKKSIDKMVKVFPNPAGKEIKVEIDSELFKSSKGIDISVINDKGETVFSSKRNKNNPLIINTNKLKSGLYVYKIYLSNNLYSGKIILNN